MTWTAFVDRSNWYLPFLDLYCRRRLKPIIVRSIRCGRSFVQTSLPHLTYTSSLVHVCNSLSSDKPISQLKQLDHCLQDSSRFEIEEKDGELRKSLNAIQSNTHALGSRRKTAKWNEKKTFHFNLLAAADQLRLRSSSSAAHTHSLFNCTEIIRFTVHIIKC